MAGNGYASHLWKGDAPEGVVGAASPERRRFRVQDTGVACGVSFRDAVLRGMPVLRAVSRQTPLF
jgi:hypothetical protein